jgi:hypothetical protein
LFAVIHKEKMDDVNIKHELTADFISKSSQRKDYFGGVMKFINNQL